jgi:hypothetical protein
MKGVSLLREVIVIGDDELEGFGCGIFGKNG